MRHLIIALGQRVSVICLILAGCASSAYAQPITLASPNTTGTFISNTDITLKPGFSTSGPFQAYISSIQTGPLNSSASQDQNYILTRTYKRGVTTAIAAPLVTDVNETIQYYDGLGRPFQIVQTNASPSGYDIIQPIVYDTYGREAQKYLPYTEQSGNGNFRPSALSTQQGFYNGSGGDGVVSTTAPYSVTVFEASPLSRSLEQGAPGTTWQPATERTASSGRTVAISYGSNNSSTAYTTDGTAVKLWRAVVVAASPAERTLSSGGTYLPGTLYLTVTKDENWVSENGKAGTLEEYKDKDGRVVLKRSFNKNGATTEVLSTYYVYDDLGNLCFVLPPASKPDGAVSATLLEQFCYQYRYDIRGRMSQKRLPGVDGWTDMIYNRLDQLVFSQDVLQRGLSSPQRSFIKYDGLGRVIMTGLGLNSTETPAIIQNVVDNWPENWEYRDKGNFHGYSNRSVPSNVQYMDVEQVNYYDNYDIPDLPNDQSASYSNRTHGLLTATKVKVLGTSVYLWTVNYYDEFGQLVKQYKQHYQAGSVSAGNYDDYVHTYSFDHRLLTTKRQHLKTGAATTTITNRYIYDHVGRRLQNYQKINTGAEVQLIDDRYNAIGQLQDRALADRLQSTSLRYNERGWLKSSGSAQFSYELKYQDGAQPQFNGNISAQAWSVASVGSNTFNYKYDNLNRLTSGVATGMSEVLTYDFNGNIKTLKRDAVAVKTYTYIGNRLNTITLGNGAYAYDGNGNAIREGRTGMEITYNSLSLPSKVGTVSYIYDASGRKLRKTGDQVTDYVDGIQYTSGAIDVIQTEVGIARRSGTAYSYEYNLTDHLGNVRYTFNKNSSTGAITRVQSDDYYPFGLRKSTGSPVSLNNKYLYNGKELQEESGLYDYGARFYDPVIARWNVVDPLAEMYDHLSPYNYGMNNPVRFTDPDGMAVEDQQEDPPKKKTIQLKEVNITASRRTNSANIALPLTRPISLPGSRISAPALPNPFFILVGLLLWPTNMNDQSSDHVTRSPIVYTKKTPADVLKDATFENETGNGHKQYKKEGGMKQADQDFDDTVVPGTERPIPGGRIGKSRDGMDINVRDHSTSNRVKGGYSGDPTYESKNPSTGAKDKVRYPR